MPRTIGYGTFTPARRAALKKAQLESARKRRKFRSEDRPVRRKAKEEVSNKRRRSKKQLILAGAAAAAIGYSVYQQRQQEKAQALRQQEWDDRMALMKRDEAKDADNALVQRLKEQSGPLTRPPDNEEEYKARTMLWGNLIPEYSEIHGRPEIYPGRPAGEVMMMSIEAATNPTDYLSQENPDEDYVILYHRTGGGGDGVDAKEAKASILREQKMKILNRDERRAGGGRSVYEANPYVWFSNKLNDSNTRDAFGEEVVQVKVPKSRLSKVNQLNTSRLSEIGEIWAAVTNDVLEGLVFEEVPQDQIKPKVERKFRIPELKK